MAENYDNIMEDRVIENDDRVIEIDDEAVVCETDISQPVVTMQMSAIAVPGPMICCVLFYLSLPQLESLKASMMQQIFT